MPALNTLVLLGAVAGLFPDAIRFAKQRYKGFPLWFRKPGYWVGLAVLVVLGGLASWLGKASDWQSAMAMGFAGPELISRLLGSDKGVVKRESDAFPLRSWWAH